MLLFFVFSTSASAYSILASDPGIDTANSPWVSAILSSIEDGNKTLIANFSASPVSGIAPLSVQFIDNSSKNVTAWEWDFNSDGVVDSTEENPVYEFVNSGSYNVSLTVVNEAAWGNITKTNYITVGEKPKASFTVTPGGGNDPLTVQFSDNSTGNVTSWYWDFGDGSTSTSQNPNHTYAAIGTYVVTLKVSNAFGSDSLINPITLSTSAPVANFTLSANSGNAPLTIQFTDTSTGIVNSRIWNFGNGNTSTDQNPSHTYYQAGTYAVTLTVINNFGFNTLSSSVNVSSGNTDGGDTGGDTGTNYSVANFTSNVTSGNTPLTVQFTDLSTGSPSSWEWDFNSDGQVDSNEQNPMYEFKDVGTYNVTLRAANDTSWANITKTNYITVENAFNADFTSNLTSGKVPLAVQFTDLSTDSPSAWEWDFNSDGQVDSTEQNPVCEFKDVGTYNVTLRAGNDTLWANVTKTNYITVENVFMADFTASPLEGEPPLTVQFTDNSTGNITSCYWDFGDGNTSTDQNPSHIYYENGDYSITLNVSNAYEYSALKMDNYITVTDGSESSGSSGSDLSGFTGTGASPEPASNVEATVQAQKYIAAGNRIRFEFTPETTCIDFIEFDAKKTLGRTMTIVEQLKGRSVLSPIEPEGSVYKYLNIWVGNEGFASEQNIGNTTVGFRVHRSDIPENETEDKVVLQRYADGKWNSLPTEKTGGDDQYIHYQASTPGFSPFTITFGNTQPFENNINQMTLQPTLHKTSNDVLNSTEKLNTSESMDLTGLKGPIRFLVVFMVVLLIALAVREKRKQ